MPCSPYRAPKLSKEEHEAFINDIQPGLLNIKLEFQGSDSTGLRIVLQTLKRYSRQLLNLFYEMQSESQDSYPFISFEYLRQFCRDTGIISVAQLDTTTEPTKGE